MSRSLTCAQRSIRPFGAGVPVSRTIRWMRGRTFHRAFHLFERWFLKLEDSSTTTQSYGHVFRTSVHSFTSQSVLSRLVT